MEYIIYNDKLNKTDLMLLNIVINENCKIGKNVKIYSNVCLLGNCEISDDVELNVNTVISNSKIGKGVKILSSHIEDCEIDENSCIGPFAHLRNNTIIGRNCRIGNFVEIKNSTLGSDCKVAHLSYIGDATLGKNCNIGCGVVFCNFNGKIKQKCVLGDNVFVGSNVNLIAPIKLEDNSFIAAGSTINKGVKKNEFAIARARQENKKNFKNPYIKHKKS